MDHLFIKRVAFESVHFDKPALQLVSLTSDQAQLWLKHNTGNRRQRRTLIEYLKRQIASGEWQGSHPQPIVFTASRLIDGQHRLTAIAESNLSNGDSVSVRVETGASEDVREYLDTGITRTLDDRVDLYPDKHLNKFAAQLCATSLSIGVTGRAGFSGKPTPDDAREFCNIHDEAIRAIYQYNKRERGTGQACVAIAAMQYYEQDPDKALEFYQDLFTPAGSVQQAQMFRDFCLHSTTTGGRNQRIEAYQKAVGCMKAHRDGREVKKVLRSDKW